MRCFFCDRSGPWSQLQAHQANAHGNLVNKVFDPQGVRMSYSLACPRCGEAIEHAVKPRAQDPQFLKEFEHEINLVAFDQYLYHCAERHPELSEENVVEGAANGDG